MMKSCSLMIAFFCGCMIGSQLERQFFLWEVAFGIGAPTITTSRCQRSHFIINNKARPGSKSSQQLRFTLLTLPGTSSQSKLYPLTAHNPFLLPKVQLLEMQLFPLQDSRTSRHGYLVTRKRLLLLQDGVGVGRIETRTSCECVSYQMFFVCWVKWETINPRNGCVGTPEAWENGFKPGITYQKWNDQERLEDNIITGQNEIYQLSIRHRYKSPLTSHYIIKLLLVDWAGLCQSICKLMHALKLLQVSVDYFEIIRDVSQQLTGTQHQIRYQTSKNQYFIFREVHSSVPIKVLDNQQDAERSGGCFQSSFRGIGGLLEYHKAPGLSSVIGFELLYLINSQTMSQINHQKLAQLASKAQSLANLSSVFTRFNQHYQDCFSFDLPANVLKTATQINARAAKQRLQPLKQTHGFPPMECFQRSELKVFSWVLVVYCQLQSHSIQEIDDTGIEEIHSIFPNKSSLFIRFTILHLKPNKTKNKRTTWNLEEEELLIKIMGQRTGRNWKEVSFEIYCLSEGLYFRHHQDCREKWNNHLDPQVNRGKWTDQEDLDLLIEAEAIDCNWSLVSQEFKSSRTQHMLKNRYRSLLTLYKKKFSEKSEKKTISKAIKDLKHKIKTLSQEKLSSKLVNIQNNHCVGQLVKEEQVKMAALQSLQNSDLDAMEDEKTQNDKSPSLTQQLQMILVDKDRFDSWIPHLAQEMDINQHPLEKIPDLDIEDDLKHQRRTSDEDDHINQWIFEFEEREDKGHEWFDDEYPPFCDL